MGTIKLILSQMSIPKPQLKFLLILFSTIMILREFRGQLTQFKQETWYGQAVDVQR